MLDVALIRKRLRAEIDRARQASAQRRQRARAAEQAYAAFLESTAIPTFRQLAHVLRAEGYPFEVQTPSGGVRLVSDRNRDDAIALELDTTQDPPQLLLVSTQSRGSRVVRRENPIAGDIPIEGLTAEALLDRLFEELRPWLA